MSKQVQQRPKVGIGVLITSDDHPDSVLMGVRKDSKGKGKYGLPGGNLEFGEEWVDCGAREVMEETGLKLLDLRYETVINAVNKAEQFHYIDIVLIGKIDKAFKKEPENTEPDKCREWVWIKWDEVPAAENLFLPLEILKESGYNPFGSKEQSH